MLAGVSNPVACLLCMFQSESSSLSTNQSSRTCTLQSVAFASSRYSS